ncbi:MAG: hypothetical protein KDL09_17270, partial [Prosthecobacter sp.]|nr:hypothetical protein [Prosthecobacter sp.]
MDSTPLSRRRDFLQTAGLGLMGWPLAQTFFCTTTPAMAQSAASTTTASALPQLNRFPRMMQNWLVDEVRAAEARGNARRDALKTKADAEAYVKSVQQRIRECFGPLPEKTPLNAKVTKTLERDGYQIENIVFESRPN